MAILGCNFNINFGQTLAPGSSLCNTLRTKLHELKALLGTCQKLARGRGAETEGGSQLFETAEKGRVVKNGPLRGGGSCKYVSVIM